MLIYYVNQALCQQALVRVVRTNDTGYASKYCTPSLPIISYTDHIFLCLLQDYNHCKCGKQYNATFTVFAVPDKKKSRLRPSGVTTMTYILKVTYLRIMRVCM